MRLTGLIAALAVTFPASAEKKPETKYKIGDSLSGVKLVKLLDGKPVKLSAYPGKTLAIVFMGSFSKTSKEVAREVEKKLKPKLPKSVVLAYVHVEDRVAAATFRKEQALTGESWVDSKAELLLALGHKSVPAAIVLDGKGRLRYSANSFSRTKLETKIRQTAGGDADR